MDGQYFPVKNQSANCSGIDGSHADELWHWDRVFDTLFDELRASEY